MQMIYYVNQLQAGIYKIMVKTTLRSSLVLSSSNTIYLRWIFGAEQILVVHQKYNGTRQRLNQWQRVVCEETKFTRLQTR